ncbi:CopG family transcriptional regulator [Amycolatopsis echigonensis]|uniref:CopG family transcriptional regulator n=1 Tax=Amycolatopsis echigonensis TaxID=2576905 RepID=A0A8E2B4Y6_9PSEU|nr:CopG family transcriptional regulator [Amycolatopsis echigonensis]MBB2500957.1 CopG family transcriptional regulator [Amycolatopsis echigonensis]
MAMTLRLNDELERALADAAARRVRDDRVRDLSSEGRSRYAALLDRLAR